MPLPSGVITCTCTFGAALDFAGGDTRCVAEARPTHNVVWEATGQPLLTFPLEASAEPGTGGEFVLPVVDQEGFVDQSGAPFTGWTYVVRLRYDRADGSKRVVVKRVQPVEGQDTIDLDLVGDGPPLDPATGTVPVVTSVNGMTGAVTVSGDGMPAGGATGQVLAKASGVDFDTEWVDQAGGGGAVDSVNGETGDVVLTAADVGAGTTAQGALADSAVQPGDLADVATSGAYADLTGTPTLGTAAAMPASAFDAAGAAAAAQAFAVQRANHTGSQAISTVTGLQTALDGKLAVGADLPAADLTGTIDDARIPAGITRDTELDAAVAALEATITPIVALDDVDWPPAAPVAGTLYLHLDN